MTDDIVARLRDTHPNFDEKPMCEAAADEIERLRAVEYDWKPLAEEIIHLRKEIEWLRALCTGAGVKPTFGW